MQKTIFDYISMIYKTKHLPKFDEEFEKIYEPFMVNRFLSVCEAWIPIVEKVNSKNLTKECHFRFLFNSIPQHMAFMSFKGVPSIRKNTEKEEIKNHLMTYLGSGTNDYKYLLSFLDDKEINNICKKYTDNQKE